MRQYTRSNVNGTALGFLLLFTHPATSEAQSITAMPDDGASLKGFLKEYLGDARLGPDTTTSISSATVKTNQGSIEVVYVTGSRWCGSGGCTMLVLEPSGASFNVIGRTTIVQLPIRLLSSTQKRHPDIGVQVKGGGAQSPYEAKLSFSGSAYPGNPTVPPAQRMVRAIEGTILLSATTKGVRLYE